VIVVSDAPWFVVDFPAAFHGAIAKVSFLEDEGAEDFIHAAQFVDFPGIGKKVGALEAKGWVRGL
jgi:hypothetical protein